MVGGAPRSVRRALAFSVAFAFALRGGVSTPARAEPPQVPEGQLPFVRVGTDLGLGEVGAWRMAEDSVGNVWLATETGVYRYDGRHALHFGAAEGLPAPYVTQIVVGHDDLVWCVTSRGLARYAHGRWDAMWEVQPGVGFEAVRRIAVDPRGLLWVTTPHGVVRERDAAGEMEIDADWPNDDADALFLEPSGAVFVGTRGALHRRDASGARSVLSKGLPHERIDSVAQDGLGRIWAAAPSGVFLLRAGAERFELRAGLAATDASIALDHAGHVWFASDRGLFHADDEGAVHKIAGLANDNVGGVYADREGSIWVLGFGVFRMAGRGLWGTHFEQQGLPSNAIWSMRRTPNDLWVGTAQGLARATASAWIPTARIPKEPIRSIVPEPSGALWLSGPAGHVFHYDPKTDALDTFDGSRGIPDSRTLVLAFDAENAVWVGTADGGLVRSVDASAPHFETVPLEGADGSGSVRDLLLDREKRFWIASDRGLFMIAHGTRRRFTTADGLRDLSIGYLLQRRSGELCVSYWLSGDVACFRLEGDRLTPTSHLDAKTGLSGEVVYILGEDAQAHLWIGTNAGVDVWDGEHVTHFGTSDGLPSSDCDARAFLADDDGDVWIGTSRGLGRFLGAHYPGPPPPPRVTLTALRESPEGGKRPLHDGDSLPYAARAVELEFVARSYLHEAAMEYETRMIGAGVGVGDAWRKTTSDHARYDALSPATYEFQARSRHPGGTWGEAASARFVIAPPWWQTALFRVGAGFALAGAFAAALWLRSSSLNRRNRVLESLVASRTRELATAHEEVARAEKLSALGRMLAHLSHELNNPMNVVANNVQPLKEYLEAMTSMLSAYRATCTNLPDGGAALASQWEASELDFVVGDASEALAMIERASQRVSAIQSDLATFLRGDATNKSKGDLNADLRETVRMVTRTPHATITVEASYGNLPEFAYAAGRMNQVFLNLLQNAVDAVGERGSIGVRTWAEAGAVYVEIGDDGPGIPPDVRDRMFEPFFTTKAVGKGTGLGLSICRQIVVEQHGGTLTLDGSRTRGAAFVIMLPTNANA